MVTASHPSRLVVERTETARSIDPMPRTSPAIL
jgi:hypothetical protein